ncbi:MAG: 4Fe-4S binding protein [Candidatus Diapherotrites archaeon]
MNWLCDFCVEHGEGKKWYLNAHNYSKELARKKKLENYDSLHLFMDQKLGEIGLKFMLTRPILRHYANDFYTKHHSGQIIPLDDALEILDIAGDFRLFDCPCEKLIDGVSSKKCLMLGPKSDRMNSLSKEKSEILDREDIENYLRGFNEKGLVHSVWTYGVPYIGCICSCDSERCLAVIGRNKFEKYGVNTTIKKSEYLASVDEKRCIGCGFCVEKCAFGAIEINQGGKAEINMEKCYGCLNCVSACNRKAISHKSREDVPDFEGKW